MLFNSYIFIFFFLPITIIVYFSLNKFKLNNLAQVFLILANLFFYSWWNIKFLPILLTSISINYIVGSKLYQFKNKAVLITGILFNIGLLGYFKYTNFFIENINLFSGTGFNTLNLILPLAISFFTFQQITFIVDSYKNKVKDYNFLNYLLFVTFFPQLIAGPIVHHSEMMPQFASLRNKIFNYKNLAIGIFIFTIGLLKKVVIADSFEFTVRVGFDMLQYISQLDAFITSLSYALQLYFDFSGYTDMAIGIALMFNISLPENFKSPYKSLSIQEFWRNWHITLSRFLRDYIYIPLGGNKFGSFNTYKNLLTVFLIGGIWHGAGWNFLFWGFLHGIAIVINRFWSSFNIKLNKFYCWLLTFSFVSFSWIFFRAKTWNDSVKILKAMFGFNDIDYYNMLAKQDYLIWLSIVFVITLLIKKTDGFDRNFKPSYLFLIVSVILFILCFDTMIEPIKEFIYFEF